jgi:hypothetical protein
MTALQSSHSAPLTLSYKQTDPHTAVRPSKNSTSDNTTVRCCVETGHMRSRQNCTALSTTVTVQCNKQQPAQQAEPSRTTFLSLVIITTQHDKISTWNSQPKTETYREKNLREYGTPFAHKNKFCQKRTLKSYCMCTLHRLVNSHIPIGMA